MCEKQHSQPAWALAAFALLAAAAVAAAAARAGAQLRAAPAVLGVFLFCIWLPGEALADLLCPGEKALRATVSSVCGLFLFSALTVLASAASLHWLVWLALPAGLAGCWRRLRSFDKTVSRTALWLAGLWAVLAAFSAVSALRFAHPQQVGALIPNQDFFWNVGNAESFLLGFEPADLRFAGVTLRYHYLTELLTAGLAMGTGASCYDIRAFWLTPLLLPMLLAVLQELAGVFMAPYTRAKSFLFFLFAFGMGGVGMWKVLSHGQSPFWNLFVRHAVTNVNGMTTALTCTAAFSAIYLALAQHGFQHRAPLCAVGAMAFVLALFAKAPVAALAALAMVCTCAVLLTRAQQPSRGALALYTLAIFGIFLGLYFTFFSSSTAANMRLHPAGTLEKSYFGNYLRLLAATHPALVRWSLPLFAVLQTFCMAPAVFTVFCIGGVYDLAHFRRCGAPRLFASALAVGGMAAFYLFDQPSMSQMYFAFGALLFMDLLAADALPRLWAWLGRRREALRDGGRMLLAGLAAVAVFTAGCNYLQSTRTGLAVVNTPPQKRLSAARSRVPLTAEEERGMAVLRSSMGQGERFATNRLHTSEAEEGNSNVYTGLSGRQAYMEGFKYAEQPPREVKPRWEKLQELFSPGTPPQRAQELCREMGVQYVAFCPLERGSDAPLRAFEPIYTSENLTIYKTGL